MEEKSEGDGWEVVSSSPRSSAKTPEVRQNGRKTTQWEHLAVEESSCDGETEVQPEDKVPVSVERRKCRLSVVSMKKALRIELVLLLGTGEIYQLRELVEKSAEFNLCNRSLLPIEGWRMIERPVTFVAANQSLVCGGEEDISCELEFMGRCGESEARGYRVPTTS